MTTVRPLDYATVAERRAPRLLHRLAMVCGVVPAIAGLACLLGYWLSEWDFFAISGFFTLVGGGAMVGVGILMALVYLALAWRATVDRRNSLRRGIVVLTILLLTLPLAAACTWAGTTLLDRPRILFVLENTGSTPINGIVLHVGASANELGPIPPGGRTRVPTRVNGSGRVAVTVTRASSTHDYVVFDSSDADTYRGRAETRIAISDDAARWEPE